MKPAVAMSERQLQSAILDLCRHMRLPRPESAASRFVAKIEFSNDGCWQWLASVKPNGYGQFGLGTSRASKRTVYAHRLAYEAAIGPIADGIELDHLCRNRACVRPDHLEPVSHEENVRRAAALTTHCPQGHPYDHANTYVWARFPGRRACRRCRIAGATTRRRATDA